MATTPPTNVDNTGAGDDKKKKEEEITPSSSENNPPPAENSDVQKEATSAQVSASGDSASVSTGDGKASEQKDKSNVGASKMEQVKLETTLTDDGPTQEVIVEKKITENDKTKDDKPENKPPTDDSGDKKDEQSSEKKEEKSAEKKEEQQPPPPPTPPPASTTPKPDAEKLQTDTPASGDSTKKEESKPSTSDKTGEEASASVQATSSSSTEDNTKKKKSTVSFESITETTIQKEESEPVLAASGSDQDKKKDNENGFPITKGDAQNLTEFQRLKALYFFNVNLDIENKKYVTWEDVEFYLLFHVTAAGKEGSEGGDLEKRLSRTTRALWEHIHDQIPLDNKQRDTLTLDQFLDTWASLIDFIVKHGQLPSIVQDWVKIGFELYATSGNENQPAVIPPNAFEQLFQKMNLGRPYAVMAYRFLTDNGGRPLDYDKVESIVRAVITSSDDEHFSHFLLPGFFKQITSKINEANKSKTSQPTDESEKSESSDKQTPTPTPPPPSSQEQQSTSSAAEQKPSEPSQAQKPAASTPSQPQQPKESAPSTPSQQPKEAPPSPGQPQQPKPPAPSTPSQQPKPPAPSTPSQQPKPSSPSAISSSQQQQQQQQQQRQPAQKPLSPQQIHERQIARLDEDDQRIRGILRDIHMDADIVEVVDGPERRVVLVHPERPLPVYLKQNPLVQQALQREAEHHPTNQSSFREANRTNAETAKPSSPQQQQQQQQTPTETKKRVTLEERISRGEAQIGPTIPLRQVQQGDSSSTSVRQVYPPLSEAQQAEQQRQAKLQATQPPPTAEKKTEESSQEQKKTEESTKEQKKGEESTEEQKKSEANPSANAVSSEQEEKKETTTKEKKELTEEDEEKIVASVLKQLTPLVERLVAAEVRRARSGETDNEDEGDFVPFPFMFGGGIPFFGAQAGPPPQAFRQQQAGFGPGPQQQTRGAQGEEFNGMGGGAQFIPPQLLMAMMNEMGQGGGGQVYPDFPPSGVPPRGPGGGPIGVEGFMMFVDEDQLAGGPPHQPRYPGPSGPRF